MCGSSYVSNLQAIETQIPKFRQLAADIQSRHIVQKVIYDTFHPNRLPSTDVLRSLTDYLEVMYFLIIASKNRHIVPYKFEVERKPA